MTGQFAEQSVVQQNGRVHTFSTVGLGRHGLAVIEHLLKSDHWQLVSAADRSAAAYARFQYMFHMRRIPCYATVAEALAHHKPELVYIATTAPGHAPLAEAVLAAGFRGNLLIEKPVTSNLPGAHALAALLQAGNWDGRAAVNFNRRCTHLYQSVKDVCLSGRLGRLQRASYKRRMKLSMKGSHYIDLFNWFVGSRPVRVSGRLASTSTVDTRGAYFFDPEAYVEVQYASGQSAVIDALNCRDDLPEGMSLEFEHGRLHVDVEETRALLTEGGTESELAAEPNKTIYEWIGNTFAALVQPGGRFTPCTLDEAVTSLEVITAAYLSHHQGRAVDLPLGEQAQAVELRLA